MKKLKKYLVYGGLFTTLSLLLSACAPATARSKKPTGFPYGFFYNYLAVPMQHLMEWIANFIGGANAYAWAIIIITFVVRMILLPIMLSQSKKSTIQQEKMRLLKPQMDLVTKYSKLAASQDEKMRISQLQMDIYKKNNVSMLGGIGCLPMLIQLPIFSGLYMAIQYSTDIYNSYFMGISLGKSNLIITIVATLMYVLQSWISIQGLAEEQKKQMKSMMFLSPGMTFVFCFISPAGLGLYFLIGGVIFVIQQLITTYWLMPRIRKNIEAEADKTPPVIVVTEEMFTSSATAAPSTTSPSTNSTAHSSGSVSNDRNRNRNAGKQRNHPKV